MIYHYSDANALRSIIENKELWLTGHEYMNDLQEFEDGFNLLKEKVDEYLDSENVANDVRVMMSHIIANLESTLAFSCSFSKEPDLLSQWRSYCPDDGGFSIGFDLDLLYPSIFAPHSNKNIRKVENCVYELEEKTHQALRYAEYCTLDLMQKYGDVRKSGAYYNTFLYFLSYCLSCKNEYFREEDEVRLFTYAHNAMEFNQVRGLSSMASKSIFSEEEISFRVNKNILIPYIKQDIDISAIKEIYIGPCKNYDSVLKGLTLFLRSKGLFAQVEIKKSNIPFRRW